MTDGATLCLHLKLEITVLDLLRFCLVPFIRRQELETNIYIQQKRDEDIDRGSRWMGR